MGKKVFYRSKLCAIASIKQRNYYYIIIYYLVLISIKNNLNPTLYEVLVKKRGSIVLGSRSFTPTNNTLYIYFEDPLNSTDSNFVTV
jgi:hypothetical protein